MSHDTNVSRVVHLPPIYKCSYIAVLISVPRLGSFPNALVTIFLTKIAQIVAKFLGDFEKHHFQSETTVSNLGSL